MVMADSVVGRGLGRNRAMNLHGCTIERLEVRLATHAHVAAEFSLRHLDNSLHTCVAIRGEAPHHGSAKKHALRSERERLEDVGSAAERSIGEHWYFAADGIDNGREREDH